MLKSKIQKGNIFAFTAVLFSSVYAIFNKVLLQDLSPITLAAISQVFSVFALLVLFGAMPEWKKIHKRPKKELLAIIVFGILATVVSPFLFLKGLDNTLATNAILIGKLDTILVAFFSVLWLREKITRDQVIGTFIMVLGLYFIVTQGALTSFHLQGGDIYIMLAALAWALSTIVFKKYLIHITPEAIIIFSNAVGALVLFFIAPYVLGIQHNFQPIADPKVFKTLAAFSLITIVFAQFLRFKALDIIPASRISTISLLSPIFAIFFAVTVLGENLGIHHVIGGILMIAGLGFSILHHQKHKHHHIHERIKHHGQH